MKKTMIALCLAGLAGAAAAQTGTSAKAPAKKPAAAQKAPAKKAAAKKPAAKKPAAKKAVAAKPSRLVVNPVTGASAPAAPIARGPGANFPAAPLPVYVGTMQCEFGANVTVAQDGADPYLYHVRSGKNAYTMRQVPTTTGVVRLQDVERGATWLQLGNKSMLMDQKRGERIADACQDGAQKARDQELKLRPPVSLLQ